MDSSREPVARGMCFRESGVEERPPCAIRAPMSFSDRHYLLQSLAECRNLSVACSTSEHHDSGLQDQCVKPPLEALGPVDNPPSILQWPLRRAVAAQGGPFRVRAPHMAF